MSLSMYRVSVPVFVRGLESLSTLLRKGELHAKDQGLEPEELVEARLAPDMLSLAGQVQRASDSAKLAAVRLSGLPAPRFEDDEASFEELQQRITRTIDHLRDVQPADLNGSEDRTVTLKVGAFEKVFRGDDYLLSFALPNFYFHVAAAHAILRHRGVAIGKLDYLGPF